ncbi:S8 family serine peptidase [Algoriphagus sp. H41]|uniref:S8 family serine peptidase n=1 Tax=Algoriphagus oliviformis TaxID=2811231 RepID=A0ABS3C2S4_9BACT|nr:S8 family serine peptidase [Algoriphagus oliviformis]MBN7811423.1 S8 family serine peptidase [Algoriphagus oliviformis]
MSSFFWMATAAAQETQSSLERLDEARGKVAAQFEEGYRHLILSKNEILLKAAAKNIPVRIPLSDGNTAELLYFDLLDQPVYYQVMNVNAAKTTGTSALQPGGELGLSLTGKGMVVGIYDQTRPKIDHVEYRNRLTQVDGSTETISSHATHVTGTILATGVSANAKGMASEATGWAFNWESDLDKMNNNAYDPASKPGGHLVSNHSYGVVLGWYRNSSNAWAWAGNTSVNANEDYRFGFYSSKSKGIDDLLYSKPYYTVVWAAGNDRTDSGDGTRPPDGPDDTLGPEGVAKNAITVGAVSNVATYTQPSDVKMSDFSNWGPTDDGRIKPDLVGMGVSVYSSSVTNNGATDAYASLSGTSMASPNVAGSLLLLQQLFAQRNANKYMWSSTVKGLAVHTAKEAGPAPGPDYMFGWGLLDAKASADMILNEDGNSRVIRELVLNQGATYEHQIISDGITPIRATIAWTDPSGTPTGAVLDPTNLMLVNDLDIRLVDEDGVTYFPWTLDPSLGAGARAVQTGDNFRDNVEQVLISSPKPKKYTLKVSHKRELKSGVQPFSLLFSAGVLDGAEETLYWIGGASGSWSEGSNWSLTSNGVAAGKIPGENTRVVFDGAAGQNKTVLLTAASRVFSVNVFGNQVLNLDLNSNMLFISNGLRVSNQITEIKNGKIVLDSESANEMLVELGQTLFENTTLSFVAGNWRMISATAVDELEVESARLTVDMAELKASEIQIYPNGVLNGNVTSLLFSEQLSVTASGQIKSGLSAQFSGTNGVFLNASSVPINTLGVGGGTLVLNSDGLDNLNIANGKAVVNVDALDVNVLGLGAGATLEFGKTAVLSVKDNMLSTATQASKALITSTAAGSSILYDIYRKLCLEHVNVSNVNKTGEGIINLGTGASVQNATGWLTQNCADVLFAKFEASYTCVGAAVTFDNQSEGSATTYLWEFGQGSTSSLKNPIFTYTSAGTYLVKLTISNSQGATDFEQQITVGANSLAKPLIVINGSQLTSQQPGTSYQWYLNGQPIAGATQRSYVASADGSYQVAIFDATCNSLSDPVVISAIPEPELSRFGIFVGPVPSYDRVSVQFVNEYRGKVTLTLVDLAGRVYESRVFGKNADELIEALALPAASGMYLLKIETSTMTFHKKLIKY